MPGSGVNETTVEEIITKSGAKEIHFSAMAYQDGGMLFRNSAIERMGEKVTSEYQRRVVDPERVRKIREFAEKVKI